jgi:hypothetical protein
VAWKHAVKPFDAAVDYLQAPPAPSPFVKFGGAARAAVVRVFVLWGLDVSEALAPNEEGRR